MGSCPRGAHAAPPPHTTEALVLRRSMSSQLLGDLAAILSLSALPNPRVVERAAYAQSALVHGGIRIRSAHPGVEHSLMICAPFHLRALEPPSSKAPHLQLCANACSCPPCVDHSRRPFPSRHLCSCPHTWRPHSSMPTWPRGPFFFSRARRFSFPLFLLGSRVESSSLCHASRFSASHNSRSSRSSFSASSDASHSLAERPTALRVRYACSAGPYSLPRSRKLTSQPRLNFSA
mmetsp:Transcript_43063/g.97329  ORF Transcript_43063/g.97329 Transcript_43063/m.97329 type:complete len:234 (+) Transcript_43063:341-1042(+)